jgi:hypothetical protein
MFRHWYTAEIRIAYSQENIRMADFDGVVREPCEAARLETFFEQHSQSHEVEIKIA